MSLLRRSPSLILNQYRQSEITSEWRGDLANLWVGLLMASERFPNTCIVPGVLLFHQNEQDQLEVGLAFTNERIATAPRAGIMVIPIELGMGGDEKGPSHAGLVTVNFRNCTYSVFNPHGLSDHLQSWGEADRALSKWVKRVFGRSMVRNTTDETCPAVQDDEPWCLLWSLWWMQCVLGGTTRQAVARLSLRRERVRQAYEFYLDFYAFRKSVVQNAVRHGVPLSSAEQVALQDTRADTQCVRQAAGEKLEVWIVSIPHENNEKAARSM